MITVIREKDIKKNNNMNNKTISVIVPVYNAEKTVEKCVNSILEQTLKGIEVICVDDASEDGSLALLKKIAEKDERLIVLHNEKNEGTFLARKRGVLEANGEFIMFADNDDWYENNAFETLYGIMVRDRIDILMYGANRVVVSDDAAHIISQDEPEILPIEERFEGENCLLTRNEIDRLWNKIINAKVCKRAFEETEDAFLTHAEDTYACWPIHFYAQSFRAITDIFYVHTIGDGITTQKMTRSNFDSWCSCRKRCSEMVGRFIENHDVSEEVKNRYELMRERWFRYCVNTLLNNVPESISEDCFDIVASYYGRSQVINEMIRRYGASEYRNRELIKKSNRQSQEIKKLRHQNHKIKESASYKIGRMTTMIPRKMKHSIGK